MQERLSVSGVTDPQAIEQSRELLKHRFYLNMRRVNDLVQMGMDNHNAAEQTSFLTGIGVLKADVLRATIVFLHAKFEDVL